METASAIQAVTPFGPDAVDADVDSPLPPGDLAEIVQRLRPARKTAPSPPRLLVGVEEGISVDDGRSGQTSIQVI